MFVKFTHIRHSKFVHLQYIPLYAYITIYLSIALLIDIWIGSHLGLMHIGAVNILVPIVCRTSVLISAGLILENGFAGSLV